MLQGVPQSQGGSRVPFCPDSGRVLVGSLVGVRAGFGLCTLSDAGGFRSMCWCSSGRVLGGRCQRIKKLLEGLFARF
eukprot:1869319-Pyramimonas_sp.AAC.1